MVKDSEGRNPLLQSLHYESDAIDLENTMKLLSHQDCLKCLKLVSRPKKLHSLDNYGFSNVVSTSLANLQEFHLSEIQIGPKTLSNVLQFCKGLKSLTLSETFNIDQEVIDIILKAHSKLREVQKISYNTFNLEYRRSNN